MDIFSLLSYLNIFAFLLFIIVGVFLGYQIYLFKKEIKLEKKLNKIPDLKLEKANQLKVKISQQSIIEKKEGKIYKKGKIYNIIIPALILILIAGYLISDFLGKSKKENVKNYTPQSPKIEYLASSGIKIYNENWEEITDESASNLKEGDRIYIGLETINDPNIDKARLRVNRDIWLPVDETANFLPDKNIFYKEYIIATDSTMLKIDGQLHSKVDGWLGE
jgi:hypothetical protein